MEPLKKYGILAGTLILVFSLFIVAQEPPKEEIKIDVEKAKTKYLEAKCNQCHAHSDFGIESKNKSPNNKAPDFSKIKIEYDKSFLIKYLNKEEAINNKKHPVAYKGSEEDLELLMSFLLLKKEQNNENNNN
ncbi:MAG: hypothetical protein N2560_05710 [Ignavibacteria bacterium]|nr:hypothetical protein [Ignavibacteria bacterium]